MKCDAGCCFFFPHVWTFGFNFGFGKNGKKGKSVWDGMERNDWYGCWFLLQARLAESQDLPRVPLREEGIVKTITLPKAYVRSVFAKELFVCRRYGGSAGVRVYLADCWVLFCVLRSARKV